MAAAAGASGLAFIVGGVLAPAAGADETAPAPGLVTITPDPDPSNQDTLTAIAQLGSQTPVQTSVNLASACVSAPSLCLSVQLPAACAPTACLSVTVLLPAVCSAIACDATAP